MTGQLQKNWRCQSDINRRRHLFARQAVRLPTFLSIYLPVYMSVSARVFCLCFAFVGVCCSISLNNLNVRVYIYIYSNICLIINLSRYSPKNAYWFSCTYTSMFNHFNLQQNSVHLHIYLLCLS